MQKITLTNSDGIQKEAFFRVLYVTLRAETDLMETVETS